MKVMLQYFDQAKDAETVYVVTDGENVAETQLTHSL
jgi:hypothetical protein